MNFKHLLPALMLGVALAASADGYKDGIEYYKAGQYDNARTILERTINDASTDKAMAYYYLGQTALAQDNKAGAKAYFDKGLAANAECPYNYVGLAAVALKDGDMHAADDNFKQALKLGKKNHEITVDIARAYYNADPVKFSADVDKYLAKARKESKNSEPSIYILEGDMEYDKGTSESLGRAATIYEQAITFDKSNPEGYVKYANAYRGVNPIFSVQKLQELLQMMPNSALAQRELAERYFDTNQWVKAADLYSTYIQNPNHFPEDKERYATLLYAVGKGMANAESAPQFSRSLEVANQLLASDPNNFVMQRVRMLDLAELNRNEEAAAAAESFFKLPQKGAFTFRPNDHLNYASVLEKLGQDSLALIQYEKAVEVDPSRADNLKNLSAAYTKNQKFMLAAESFDQYIALSENPSLTDYLQASGRWLNAASHAADSIEAIASAEKGLMAINKVIEGASQIAPEYYQRQGALNYIKAGSKADQNVFDSFSKVVEVLDADPANADPNNSANKLNLYSIAYLYLGSYYQELGDTENQNAMYKKSDNYKKILNGEPVEE